MFRLRRDVYQAQTRHALLNNSLTVKIGDIVAPLPTTNSILTNATATVTLTTRPFLGLVIGFSKANGGVITTGTDPANTPGQLVTAADNTTVASYHVVYIPITEQMEFSADLSAAAGTTTNSDGVFVWFSLSDCRNVSESTVLQYGSASAPLRIFSYGVDPEDSASKRIICRFQLTGNPSKA